MSAWRLDPYSASTLWERIAEHSLNPLGAVQRSLHAVYFEEYFRTLGAKTILAEFEYFDRDFIEDYAAYYVRCFTQYKRTCVRLHFFDEPVSGREFEELFGEVSGPIRRRLSSSYLGFVVIRPLPKYAIGRTCLRTYPAAGGRAFPITRRYTANLFGLELAVETLAFQEQDNVIAACATSALWSTFHGTGVVFHHRIPSPIEITRAATAHVADDSRVLPSRGLTTAQMADAIRACDLEPFMTRPATDFDLQVAVRAYLLGKVPVLLVGPIFRRRDFVSAEKEPAALGIHAVAVTGFFSAKPPPPDPERFCADAMCVEKLYCHDDRVGPFARMELAFLDESKRPYLSTSSAETNEEMGDLVFRPDGVLVPLYHKIRVPHLRVLRELSVFDDYLRWLRGEASEAEIEAVVWDLQLRAANDLTAEWLDAPGYGPDRRALLETRLPRFVWLGRGRTATGGTVDLVFDATGLEAANLCICFAECSTTTLSMIAAITGALRHDGLLPVAQFPLCTGVLERLAPS